jgi:flagellar biosynthesis protein FliP
MFAKYFIKESTSMKMMFKLALAALIFGASSLALAQSTVTVPTVNFSMKSTSNPKEIVSSLQILILLTVLTLAPAILILMTSFTRFYAKLSVLNKCRPTNCW